MSRITKTYRLLAVLLVTVLLVPMLTIGSYASEKVSYLFNFDNGTTQQQGQKNDVGSPSGAVAGVSILKANFRLGNARFYMLDAEGNRACDNSARYTTEYTPPPISWSRSSGTLKRKTGRNFVQGSPPGTMMRLSSVTASLRKSPSARSGRSGCCKIRLRKSPWELRKSKKAVVRNSASRNWNAPSVAWKTG